MSTPFEKFCAHLPKPPVKRGNSWWVNCPAHRDRSPSLKVDVRNDGALLLKCWAGCSTHEIINAIGLELHDLFPERQDYHKPALPPLSPYDALRVLTFEAKIVALAAHALTENIPLPEAFKARVAEAQALIDEVIAYSMEVRHYGR